MSGVSYSWFYVCNLRWYLQRYAKPFSWSDELRTISYRLSKIYKFCDWNKILTSSNDQSINQNFTVYSITSFFFILTQHPPVGHGLPIHEVSRSHTTKHHKRQDSSGRVTSSSQRPLPYNTQHSQQTNNHNPGGIRIHSLSRRATADPRLRPRGRWTDIQ